MVFLDELKDLKLYKREMALPINDKKIREGSNVILLTPNYDSTLRFMDLPYIVNKMHTYNSYFLERNVNYYINHETGTLTDVTDEYQEYLFEISEDQLGGVEYGEI